MFLRAMIATGVESRTEVFRSIGRMASMFSSISVVPWGTSIANFSTTENIMVVEEFLVLGCKVYCPKIASCSFDADKSFGCVSLHIFGSQSLGKISFEIISGLAPVSRRKAIRCTMHFWRHLKCVQNMLTAL